MSMAYTTTDINSIDAAIIELATGKRVVKLAIAGKEFEFAQTNLSDLKSLRTDIAASLGLTTLRSYAKNGGRGL